MNYGVFGGASRRPRPPRQVKAGMLIDTVVAQGHMPGGEHARKTVLTKARQLANKVQARRKSMEQAVRQLAAFARSKFPNWQAHAAAGGAPSSPSSLPVSTNGATAPGGAGSSASMDMPSMPSMPPSTSTPAQGSMISPPAQQPTLTTTAPSPSATELAHAQMMQAQQVALERAQDAGVITSMAILQQAAPQTAMEKWQMALATVPPAFKTEVNEWAIGCLRSNQAVSAAEDLAMGIAEVGRARMGIANGKTPDEVMDRLNQMLKQMPAEQQRDVKRCAELMLALKALSGNRNAFPIQVYTHVQDMLQHYTVDRTGSIVAVTSVPIEETVAALNQIQHDDAVRTGVMPSQVPSAMVAPIAPSPIFVASAVSETSPNQIVGATPLPQPQPGFPFVPDPVAPPMTPVMPPGYVAAGGSMSPATPMVPPSTPPAMDLPPMPISQASAAPGETPAYLREDETESVEPPSFSDQIEQPAATGMEQAPPWTSEEDFLAMSVSQAAPLAIVPHPEEEKKEGVAALMAHPYAKYVGIGALVLGGAMLLRRPRGIQ